MASIPELQEVLAEYAEARTVKASSEFMSLYQRYKSLRSRFDERLRSPSIPTVLKQRAESIIDQVFDDSEFTPEKLEKYVTTGITVTTARKPSDAENRLWESLTAVVSAVEKLDEQFATDMSA